MGAETGAPPAGGGAGRLAQGAGVVLGGRLVGRAGGFVVQLVLGRVLGPAAYGLYAIGWNLLQLVALPASLGLENGVVRYGARHWAREPATARAFVRRGLALAVASSAVTGVLLFLSAPALADLYRKPELAPILALFAAGLCFAPALRVAAAGSRVSQRMRYSVYAEDLSQPLFHILLVAVAFALGFRLLGAVAAAVVSYLCSLALAVWYLGRLFSDVSDSGAARSGTAGQAAELLRFSLPTAAAGVLAMSVVWLDRLLVGYFLSETETGVYQAASQIAVVFHLLLTSLNAIFAPMIADLHHRGEKRQLDELFKVTTKWGLYLGLPAYLTVLFAPAEMLTVLLDGRYATGAQPMVVLATAQTINLATGAVGTILIMSGRQQPWLWLSAIAVAVNLTLNLLLIPAFGLTGAAVGTLLTVVVLFGGGLAVVRSGLGLWPYDRRYLKGLAAAAVAAAALALTRQLALPSDGMRLLLTAVVAAGAFAGALALFGFDTEDRELLGLLRRLGWRRPR